MKYAVILSILISVFIWKVMWFAYKDLITEAELRGRNQAFREVVEYQKTGAKLIWHANQFMWEYEDGKVRANEIRNTWVEQPDGYPSPSKSYLRHPYD